MLFLLLVGSAVALAMAMGAMARNFWLGALAAQFSPQYGVIMASVSVGFFLLDRPDFGVTTALLTMLNIGEVLYRIRWGKGRRFKGDREERDSSTLHIFLANVNADNHDAERIARVVKNADPDLVLLIEVSPDINRSLGEHLGDDWNERSYHVYRGAKFGLKVVSRFPINDIVLGDEEDEKTCNLPAMNGVLQHPSGMIRLIVAHPLSPERPWWLRPRRAYLMKGAEIASQSSEEVILLGDLNAAPWDPLFGDLLRNSGLRDARKGFGYTGTWPVAFPPLLIPLDHILVSRGIKVKRFVRGEGIGSDHWPILASLQHAKGPEEHKGEKD